MKRLSYAFLITIFLIGFSCKDKQGKNDLLKYQQVEATEVNNVDLVKKLFDLLDEQKMDKVSSLMTEDNKIYAESSDEPVSFNEMAPFIQDFYNAFPDYKHHIKNIIAAGNYVVAQFRYTGTHKHKFNSLEPTGNEINYKGIFIFKVVDSKISHIWFVEDQLTMYQQLGMELKIKKATE